MTTASISASRYETLTAIAHMEFPEYDSPPPEPFGLVRSWLARAVELQVREPRALALATADAHGRPSNRIVAFNTITDRGLVFASHSTSQKGSELAVNPWASGVLYWRETGQQIILSGPVMKLADAESDDLWFSRPVPLHSMSTVSRQSDPLVDVTAMLSEVGRLEAIGGPLPRPDRFVGYRLVPVAIEFWCASVDRLHRRLRYDRDAHGWRTAQLQP